MVEAAGASAVAVHGRTRQQKGNAPGPADWAAIRAVKAALRIPVIANGNIRTYQDAQDCLAHTGSGPRAAPRRRARPAALLRVASRCRRGRGLQVRGRGPDRCAGGRGASGRPPRSGGGEFVH